MCNFFQKSDLNPRNIDKTVSDIRIRIRFPFGRSFRISVSGSKLTILRDTQPANRIVIISVLLLPKLKSDTGSRSVFFPNFWLRIRVRNKNAESRRIRLGHSGSGPTSVKDLIKPSPWCLPVYFAKTSKSEKQAHSRYFNRKQSQNAFGWKFEQNKKPAGELKTKPRRKIKKVCIILKQ